MNPPIAYALRVEHPSPSSPLVLDPREQPRPRRGLGRATPVAIAATAIPILGSVTMIIAGPLLANWLRSQGTMGVIYFTITFAILGSIAFAPTYTTSAIAGWTFGFARGFPAVIIGTVLGATFCFLSAKRVAGDRVASTFHEHPRWDVVRRALLEENKLKTLWIVFLMRLSPVLPFGTANVLLATSGVPFGIYVLGTLLGLAPRMGLVALAAASAGNLDPESEGNWVMWVVGAVATLVCIAIMIVIGQHALARATQLNPGTSEG